MHAFRYVGDQLFCEGVPVAALVRKFGTPLYVYSQRTLVERWRELDAALAPVEHLVCFAVKANSNLAVLRALAQAGSGFDIVSRGELERVLAAGGDAGRCIFTGVGKSEEEIAFALRQGIYCFNAESEPELERIDRIAARLGRVAPVSVRVNPDVSADTHHKITTGTYADKFGIAFEEIEGVYARAAKRRHLRLRGVQMHIGSQITTVRPFEESVRKVAPLAQRLKDRYGIEFFSIGGGLGIVYNPALASGDPAWWQTSEGRRFLTAHRYAAHLLPLLKPLGLRVLIEPGRYICGNAGILVTRVEYIKRTGRKTFVIVDAAMNDLIRPAFYDAYHEIVPVTRARPGAHMTACDVVGPVCESGDFFCKDRPLPPVSEGDLLALMSAGAYGTVMASNYNSRPLPAEALVFGRRAALVRRRQTVREVFESEQPAPWLR
ncbi:MAG: diaminopimelate decarboxylase [Verrucomicrobiales bacterium]|nr:diaminopimelate decarboxylase [Verrucomicrobiales bacterium]